MQCFYLQRKSDVLTDAASHTPDLELLFFEKRKAYTLVFVVNKIKILILLSSSYQQ